MFWTQEKETGIKFNPGLSANRPSNNWAQVVKSNNKGTIPREFVTTSDNSKTHSTAIRYIHLFELEKNIQISKSGIGQIVYRSGELSG